jgi:large subunit ribosomal protein L4
MPLKMRRAALRSALSAKAADDGIICVDGLTLSDPKTRTFAATLEKLAGTSSVLILIPEKSDDYDSLTRASRNLAHVKTLNARYLNVRDLLGFDKVLLPLPALEVISGYLGERGA